jgi:PTS system, glucose subfamily, IIA component
MKEENRIEQNQHFVSELLELLGGIQNVSNITHCTTRLRFVLKDRKRVNAQQIEDREGVLGIIERGGQFQIVVGSTAPELCQILLKTEEVAALTNFSDMETKQLISAHCDEVIYNPIRGQVCSLSMSKEIIYAQEMLGKGVLIQPQDGHVYAPFAGIVQVIAHTLHAIGVCSDTGVELLIHIGLDTTQLGGVHFHTHVKVGERVQIGQKLLDFDITQLHESGTDLETFVIVSNTRDYHAIEQIAEGYTQQGKELIKVIARDSCLSEMKS